MALETIFGLVVQIVTILFFLTAIFPTLETIRTGNTKCYPFPTFVLAFIGCTAMLDQGLLISNSTLIIPNFIGFVVHGCSLVAFAAVVTPKGLILRILGVVVCGLIFVHIYVYHMLNDIKSQEQVLGTVFVASNLGLMGLLVNEILNNFRNKNADGSPMVVMTSLLIFSSTWLLYGLFLGDPSIFMPHTLNVTLVLVKMRLITTYGEKALKTD